MLNKLKNAISYAKRDGVFLFLICLTGSHIGQDYNNWQWTIGLAAASFFLLREIHRIHDWFAIPTFYFVATGLISVLLSIWKSKSVIFICSASMSTSCFIGAIACGLLFRKTQREALIILGLANVGFMFIEQLFGTEYYVQRQSGFLDYAGMNGCLLALSIPFILEKIVGSPDKGNAVIWLLTILCGLYLSNSTIPYIVAGLVSVTYLVVRLKSSLLSVLAGTIALGFASYQGIHRTSQVMRLDAYRIFMTYWYEHCSLWFGGGAGSFKVLSRDIQLQTGFMVVKNPDPTVHEVVISYWPWLHSDLLQILFEYGIVGLSFAILVFSAASFNLYRRKDYSTLSMLLGIGVSAVLNYPLRYFIFDVLGTIALARACDKEHTCPQ